MSQITSDSLAKFCEPEWVSRAYGEYLIASADATANLLGEISDAVGSDNVENVIATESDYLITKRDRITKLVQAAMIEDGVTDVDALAAGSPQFIAKCNEMAQYQGEVSTLYDELYDHFGDYDLSTWERVYNADPDAAAITTDNVIDLVDDLVDSIAANHRLPSGTRFTFNEGFVDFREVMKTIILRGAIGDENGEFSIHAVNGKDVSLGYIKLSFNEAIEQIKSSFASAIAWGQGFLSAGKGSVSDALANFDANISNVISDMGSRFAKTISTVRTTIANCANDVIAFTINAYETLGWKAVVDDVFDIVNNTDAATYSGTNPFGCVSFKVAGDALVATAKTIAAVGAGIISGVLNILKKLYNKAWPYVSMITQNPVDIQVANSSDESYTISGMQYKTIWNDGDPYQLKVGFGGTLPDQNDFEDALDAMLDNWYGIDLYFGQLCFKLKHWRYGQSNRVEFATDIVFKPKCLDFDGLAGSGLFDIIDLGSSATYNCFGCSSANNLLNLDAWLSRGQYYFNDNDYLGDRNVGEAKAWIGFGAGILLVEYLAHKVMLEINVGCSSKYGFYVSGFSDVISQHDHIFRADTYPIAVMSWDRISGSTDPTTAPTNLTNADFMIQATGYVSSPQYGSDLDGFYYYDPDLKNSSGGHQNKRGLIDIVGGLMCAFIVQQLDKHLSPDDYIFLPYSKNTESFNGGRYNILTDEQYKSIRTIIANAVVLIVVVVAALVICKSVVNFFKAKKIAKWAQKQGELDNKMWNGQKLSVIEAFKYKRALKKNGALSNLSSGLLGSGSVSDALHQAVSTLQDANVIPSKDNEANLLYQPMSDNLSIIKRRIG